jgi:hypothetical protein
MLRIIELQSLASRSIRSLVMGRAGRQILSVLALLCLVAFAGMVHAAPINYGDFSGNTVDYLQVTEDANSAGDAPPLFGAPSVSGDSLDFDPVGFGASTTGAAGNDTTDGNLKFTIMAKGGNAIDSVSLSEAGDTTLSGFGTDATYTSVTAQGVMNILSVDGVGITPINVPINLIFSPSGGTFGLATNGGGGPLFSSGWSGSWLKNVKQVLIDNNISHTVGATKVSINLDNTLVALSEAGTHALIAKKDFGGVSFTVNIPEPATWLLATVCGVVAAFRARRR